MKIIVFERHPIAYFVQRYLFKYNIYIYIYIYIYRERERERVRKDFKNPQLTSPSML